MRGEDEVPDRREAGPNQDPPEPAARGPEAAGDAEAILAEEDPRLLVLRLIEQDPFEIQARTHRRLRVRAALVSPEKVFLHAAGRIALAARDRPPASDLSEWIDAAVDLTIDSLIQEQREDGSRNRAIEDADDVAYYDELATLFHVSAREARLACMVLNDLPELHRRAFFDVFYLGESVEAFARGRDLPVHRVTRILQEVGLAVTRRIEATRRRGKGGRGGRL